MKRAIAAAIDFASPKACFARLLAGGRRPSPTKDGHIGMLPCSAKYWQAFFDAAGCADLAARFAFKDRQERNANIRGLYSSEGTLRFVRPTTKFARVPAWVRLPAPLRGQHSREILHQAGLSDPEVDRLVSRGIVIELAAIRSDNHGI